MRAAAQRELLLVSGRDDHGLVAESDVALAGRPGGARTAEVADGTLVRVLASRGEWTRVESVEGPRAAGWVNDFYLRGVLHACARGLPRSAQVELLGLAEGRVRVRTVEGAREALVPRAALFELPC